MKLKIIRGTICGGKRVNPDDVVEVDAREARVLIMSGKAVEVGEESAEEKPRRGRKPKSD